mmetsp:Transcript_25951/g.29673  ORF Transcript_25951/g.29673 Transcript_25951/m.29673 type:complete len:535 (-) Transcript_25951:2-1606(-)
MNRTDHLQNQPSHPFRIAFGSCNNQNLTNPLWNVISERNPAAFVWAGDAIYADINVGYDWTQFPPKAKHKSATPQSLYHNYEKQKSNPSYLDFLSTTNATVLGTIDDHDFGMNNADGTFVFKRESNLAFLEFVEEPKDSLIYKRALKGNGVYGVKVFDFSRSEGSYLLSDEEAGIDSDLFDHQSDGDKDKSSPGGQQSKRVAIFVLDCRSNRTPWSEGIKGWMPNYDGDFLGERQWEWFENSIKRSNAAVNIIVNGLQVHAYRFPNSNSVELWSHFPASRQRLYDAILNDNVKAPIIASGDVHMAQFMRKDCIRKETSGNADSTFRPLIEFTSSGMTHSWATNFASSEKFHKTWRYYPMHIISKSLMTLVHMVFPMPELMVSNGKCDNMNNRCVNGGAENAKDGRQFSLEQNFGEFEFDFEQGVVTMRAIGKDSNAPPMLSATFSFDQLSGKTAMPGSVANNEKISQNLPLLDGNKVDGEYICVNYKDVPSLVHITFASIGISSFLAVLLLGPQFLLVAIFLKKIIGRKQKASK